MVLGHPLDSTLNNIENDGPFSNFGKLAGMFGGEYTRKMLDGEESCVNLFEESRYEKYLKLREGVVKYVLDKKVKPYCDDVTRIDIIGNFIVYLSKSIVFENINEINFAYFESMKNNLKFEYIGKFANGFPSFFEDFGKIKSAPKYQSKYVDSITGIEKIITYCSKTAQENGKFFGLNLPDGNARKGVEKTPVDDRFIKTEKAENNKTIDLTQYTDNLGNFVDLSVKSDTRNGQKYGHRAVAFLEQTSGQWYVLDPYYSGGRGTKPQLFSEYSKKDKILQANFYAAEIQVEKDKIV